MSKTRYRAGRS